MEMDTTVDTRRDSPGRHAPVSRVVTRDSCAVLVSREWCHAAVRRNLGESDTFSQIQTAYQTDAADIRPRRPLLAVPTLHITGGGYSQQRPSNSVVGIFEVVRKSAFFATHASADFG